MKKTAIDGLLGVLLVLLSCVTMLKRGARQPAGEFYGGDYSEFIDNSPEASISCGEFFALLKAQSPKPDTVIKALQVLKQNKPRYFSRYTLLPNSESIQGSDWASPRALVPGGNGTMMLTFNGNPKHVGYEQLELLCIDPIKAKFSFQMITFPKEAAQSPEYLKPADLKAPFVISPVNGYNEFKHDCANCHGLVTKRRGIGAGHKDPDTQVRQDQEICDYLSQK